MSVVTEHGADFDRGAAAVVNGVEDYLEEAIVSNFLQKGQVPLIKNSSEYFHSLHLHVLINPAHLMLHQ